MAKIQSAVKKVFITGGSSDIGLVVCRQFLEADHSVVAHYNSGRPELTELAECWPGRVHLVQVDFSQPDGIDQLVHKYRSETSGIDIFINAAAGYKPIPFSNINSQSILAAVTLNLMPGLLLMQHFVPEMIKSGFGRIVNLSSIGVKFHGGYNGFLYSLSKHALEFLPADHKNWAAHNVFVNNIRVGLTNTRFHDHNPSKNIADRIALVPAQRMAEPEEIARKIYWLGSEENSFITG
ncbi:MAG: SDR family oxidoreductase, partial [Planctomycetaceae bacterium]